MAIFTFDTVKRWVREHFVNKDIAGTWLPEVTCSGTPFTSITYDPIIRYGVWQRYGDIVFYSFYFRVSAFTLGGGTGYLRVSLPFVCRSGSEHTVRGVASMGGPAVGASMVVFGTLPGQARGAFTGFNDNAAWVNLPISGLAAGDSFLCSGWYWIE